MIISATIRNSNQENDITVSTNTNTREVSIPGKTDGRGSSVNGGELLFLALATCFCNDVYREAARREMQIELVEVTVSGEFGKEGEAGSNITYTATIQSSNSSSEQIKDLILHVDKVAEIHNTLRKGVSVSLKE
ncbi:OsmC family protein [Cytophagaceae bacterium DM2B3-1]|uniref:OsmC family protein n=1 Tax=Xanthocytophaga flava TaxID=3048013 RepID=A0ABT7CQZ3_9BACT|nr:OsmC family protein [Xanthocytophaga flavus]MDJ1495380.1 OsmC family protein [Xanthocytophaga flavus]